MAKQEQKDNELLKENMIEGEKAVVLLYHKPGRNVVMDEINKCAWRKELKGILESVTEKGVHDACVCEAKDDKRSADCLYKWGKSSVSRIKLYVAHSSCGDKPWYIVYGLGENESKGKSKDPDFEHAYARQKQMFTMLAHNILCIDGLNIGSVPAQRPVVITYHGTRKNNKHKQKQR